MGTRSRIGIRNADDTVDSIYCHWDGYPEHNGRLLVEHWTDEARIREMISLGSLSSLGSEIGTKHEFRNPMPYGSKAYDEWEEQHWTMCTFHGRDRGDRHTGPEHSRSVAAFLALDMGEEYHYIFHYGRWMVQTTDGWKPVEDVLKKAA